ncbi:recombinase family protein [Metabacillus endolithicus]|uniref:recombinase family protein n=1 Tax=Metabacillus endolithicus TaxID=1535204 RepID=UPI001FFBE47D|nr:recombinase family protein [Metabacillus endolithicus]UPG65545.1 recombinase family protein [Metabacillus endolithicus]
MTETAIGYARKSIYVSGLEDERESVLYQLNQIEEYADEHDLELINIYSDIGVSGVLKSRPDLNKMLAFLRNYVQEKDEKVNYLIFYNQERLARDLSTSIELMLEITELVEEIVFVADETNTSIRNFRSTFLVNAAKAAENRRFIKKRLRQGRKAKVVYSNLYRSTFKPLGYVQISKRRN